MPALSVAVALAASNVTVGVASSSTIVTVWTVVAPADAFTSEPVAIVTMIVSSSSSSPSSETTTLSVPVVVPALIVRLPSARSWSVVPVAVPETV